MSHSYAEEKSLLDLLAVARHNILMFPPLAWHQSFRTQQTDRISVIETHQRMATWYDEPVRRMR